MVAGVTCGLAPDLGNAPACAMPISAVTPPGKRSSADLRRSSVESDLGAVLLLHRARQLQRAAFHGEVQVAHRKSAQHVAHGAAGKEQA